MLTVFRHDVVNKFNFLAHSRRWQSSTRSLEDISTTFRKSLDELWERQWASDTERRNIGIAVSGGVDSMALAQLCVSLKRSNPEMYRFRAFVVDHQARHGSTDEAQHVSRELDRIGLDSQVLTLDWVEYGGSSAGASHFENAARRLRYRALAAGCLQHNLNALLVGHHASDVAETVVQRILKGMTGPGLHGINAISNLPECADLYGVTDSGKLSVPDLEASREKRQGSQLIALEGGGIKLLRPLLSLAKADLIDVCQKNRVTWFEDATNSDLALASRNTIRHLHNTDLLPAALRPQAVLKLANEISITQDHIASTARKIISRLSITLNLRNSELQVMIPLGLRIYIDAENPQHSLAVQSKIVLEICSLLWRTSSVKGSTAVDAAEFVFAIKSNDVSEENTAAFALGFLQITKKSASSDGTEFSITVRPPMKQQAESAQRLHFNDISMRGTYEPNSVLSLTWTLWSERYWIGVAHVANRREQQAGLLPRPQIYVRALRESDLTKLYDIAPFGRPFRAALDLALKQAPGVTRFSIPVLLQRDPATDDGDERETVVALPSLGWCRSAWVRYQPKNAEMDKKVAAKLRRDDSVWLWDIRYKNIRDFPFGDNHFLINTWTKKARLQSRAGLKNISGNRLGVQI